MALRSLLFLGAASTTLALPGIFQRSAELPTISASAVPVADIDDAPKPTLEPVAPPAINPEDLDILTPDKKVSLFYKSRPVIVRRDGDTTEDATLAELNFDFQYPSIPLDHSSFVETVSCGSSDLTATFADATGFDYAQSSWPQDCKFILITSTAGCGTDDQNGLFLADSVAFSDNSVSATGSFVDVQDIMDTLNIQWGKLSAPLQSNRTVNATKTDYGCPACGPSSDKKVDDSLGYYGGDQATIMSQFAPGTSNATSAELQRRGLLDDFIDTIGDAVDTIGDVISDTVDDVIDGAGDIIDGVGDVIGDVIDEVGDVIDDIGDTIGDVVDGVIDFAGDVIDGITDALDGDYSQSVTLDIDVFAHYLNDADYVNDLAQSSDGKGEGADDHEAPWENAYLLYSFGAPEKQEGDEAAKTEDTAALQEREVSSGLNLYCVDCGVKGSVTTTGSISLTLQGIDECKISVQGNLEAGLFLGLEMFVAFEEKYEKDLIKKSLLGWEIPGIIVFGPYARLGVEAGVEIKAEGSVLLGAKAEWTGFEATLDLLDAEKSTQSGWTPEVTRKFEAKGKVGVEASLGLPVAVGVGVDLLGGKWKKGVELKDTPAIVAEAEFEISVEHESTTSADGTETSDTEVDVNDGCYGVAWNIKLKNELVVAVTDVAEWTLIPEWESEPLAEGCIGYQEPEDEEEGRDDEEGEGSTGEEGTGEEGTGEEGTGEEGTGEEGTGEEGTGEESTDSDGTGEEGTGEEGSGSGGDNNDGSDGTGEEGTGEEDTGSDGSNGESSKNGGIDEGTGDNGTGNEGTGNEGSGDNGSGDNGSSDNGSDGDNTGDNGSGEETTPPPPTPKLCTGPITKVPASETGSLTCAGKKGPFKPGGGVRIKKPFAVAGNKACARECLNNEQCQAFAFNTKKKMCSLFRKSISELGFADGSHIKVNDVGCFQNKNCPASEASTLLKRQDTETVQIAQVSDLSGSYKLAATEDGNVEVVKATDAVASSTSFATLDILVVGDAGARLLHYFPAILASTGVSRLRLASLDKLPQSSEFVAFAPVAVDGTQILVAVDTEGEASYPVVCAIENVGTKVFLVANADGAEETLKAEGLRDAVTGGVVKKCAPLALKAQ